jgi:hypothetical protein
MAGHQIVKEPLKYYFQILFYSDKILAKFVGLINLHSIMTYTCLLKRIGVIYCKK